MYALPHIECGPYWTCHSNMSHFTITRVGLLGTCNIYGKVEEMSQHAINSTALYFVHCVWHMHFAQPKMMLFGLFKCSPFLTFLNFKFLPGFGESKSSSSTSSEDEDAVTCDDASRTVLLFVCGVFGDGTTKLQNKI